ncbi:MAG: caspase family protein, partial [Thiomargarita sp.]|nr:caspase family protein [Thiomargarita sp.]
MKRLFLLILLFISTPILAKDRIALVIGNANYSSNGWSSLNNTLNDANDMAKVLRELDFEVVFLLNGTKKQMLLKMTEFVDKLPNKKVGLFYYSGHGVQIDGDNYLIPLDTNVNTIADVQFETVNMMRILYNIRDASDGLNIIILDSCRNNPFKGMFAAKGKVAKAGLAETGSISGSIIAYAAQPGYPAYESRGRNSFFTKHLL